MLANTIGSAISHPLHSTDMTLKTPAFVLSSCSVRADYRGQSQATCRDECLADEVAVCLQKYGLLSTGWEELPTWPFADFVFNQPSDWFQNCNKLKQAGFNGMKVDTDQVHYRLKMAPVLLHQPYCQTARGG